ncbi:MAG TPA: hypothetical protein VF540_12535 [Segetibacter sp.]|jgi:hypothetical protein
METNSKILEELKEISPLLTQVYNRNPYSISFSYFTHLADDVVGKIKSGTEPEWFFTKENVYSTPADYFETLPTTILQKAKREKSKSAVFEEMEQISPLLNTISKKPVYTVPDGFLENATWEKGTSVTEKAKVISFTRVNKAVRYVAAAVIFGLLALGIFLFTGKQNTGSANAKAAAQVKQLSEQEIVDFLKTTAPAENMVSNVNSSNSKENDIKSSVSKMSDTEIQEFLNENGEQVEM